MITVGMLLIFTGAMGAIGASTVNTGPSVANDQPTFDTVILGRMRTLQALFIAELVFTAIAFVGAALVLRNR
ncbi:MAG TPA: hypothetical protein VIH83_00965 [Candidatus Bathyarchaeia archaeon]